VAMEVREILASLGFRKLDEVVGRPDLLQQREMPDGTIEIRLKGSAGQSFGAWATNGMRLILEGEANDYVGKGLCGGEIAIMPAAEADFNPHENVILGNTILYGATSGRLFASGRAVDRFAFRTSGAVALVEGAVDPCCEYMTGGTVVVLGEVGRNFAAGMSNGVAYVFDPNEQLPSRYNPEMVRLERVMALDDREDLYRLIDEHFERTGSPRARMILDAWETYRANFWKVAPNAPPPPPPAPVEAATAGQASESGLAERA
jgi:glutamate synthase (ferredoxin)